jgi:hypothetical protein
VRPDTGYPAIFPVQNLKVFSKYKEKNSKKPAET